MTKIYIFPLILIFFIVFVIWICSIDEPCYLNLVFEDQSGIIEVNRMDITPNIVLRGYENIHSITDKQCIKKVVNYLNSIPLKYIDEGKGFDSSGGGTIIFYDSNGICVGWVAINRENYIYNSRNLTIFKPHEINLQIIDKLNDL